MTLLRRCDAVLVLADVEQALAAARLRPDPARAEAAVLRDAFTSMRPETSQTPDTSTGSEDRLNALIESYASAGAQTRTALLDEMFAIQPLDTPSWTIAEPAVAPIPTPRIPHDDDLDQPRSAAQRERLLAMLESPDREHRDLAARALEKWPEPDIRLAVLRPYLRGDIDRSVGGSLAGAVRTLSEAELRADGILPGRVLLAASQLFPGDTNLLSVLLDWWQQGPPIVRREVQEFLRFTSADFLAEALSSRLEAGEWGFAELLSGRTLLRTPALTEFCERLQVAGLAALASSIRLVDGPLRNPDAKQHDAAALTALCDRGQAAKSSQEPSREELLDLARSGRPDQIRRALLLFAETQEASRPNQDSELQDLLSALLTHPKPKVRLQAHRTARQLLDRPTYLQHTSILLTDPHPAVLVVAIRTLSHANWEPAIPTMVTLLHHSHPIVRAETTSGLVRMGRPALGALRRAADHARPDKRAGYTLVLDQIVAADADRDASQS